MKDIYTIYGDTAELLGIKAGGTYYNHCFLKDLKPMTL